MRLWQPHEIDPAVIAGETVAMIGYGNHGRSHALNLRDAGFAVRVGLHDGARARPTAEADGFTVTNVSAAAAGAGLVMLAAPDERHGAIWNESLSGAMAPGAALLVCSGYALQYGAIRPTPGIDVVLASPKGPGRLVREAWFGRAAVIGVAAVHQDATGRALPRALAYLGALRCAGNGVLETTIRDEVEVDLFGEQTVLCGGMVALMQAAFDVMVEAGYPAELAYIDCIQEVKLVADLVAERGIGGMYAAVSPTARFGGTLVGPEVVGPEARRAMREALARIRDGSFARRFAAGALPEAQSAPRDGDGLCEEAGKRVRALTRPR